MSEQANDDDKTAHRFLQAARTVRRVQRAGKPTAELLVNIPKDEATKLGIDAGDPVDVRADLQNSQLTIKKLVPERDNPQREPFDYRQLVKRK